MTMTNRTFGIEIEAKGLTIYRAAQAIAATGLACQAEDYNHQTRTGWKVITDASVPGGFEAVSPVLSGEDGISQVRTVAAALVAAGAKVDKDCGLHVHVGAGDLSAADILNCVKRYAAHEAAIDAVMPFSRRARNSYYCGSMVEVAVSLETSMRRRAMSADTTARSLCSLMGDQRMYKLNVCAFMRHGTLEFRQHSGTVSGMKMENWIRFCVNFVEASRMPAVVVEMPAAPVVQTSLPLAPMSTVQRANAIEKKFAKLAEMLDAHDWRGNPISAAALAQGMEITENTLISYISQFRARYNAGVKARSGRGYFKSDSRCLAAVVAGTAAPVTVAAPIVPPVRRQPVYVDPGLFAGLSRDVVSYFAERASDFSNTCA